MLKFALLLELASSPMRQEFFIYIMPTNIVLKMFWIKQLRYFRY